MSRNNVNYACALAVDLQNMSFANQCESIQIHVYIYVNTDIDRNPDIEVDMDITCIWT